MASKVAGTRPHLVCPKAKPFTTTLASCPTPQGKPVHPSEPRQVIGSCLPVQRGLTSCPAPPGPSSRSHLCYSADSSVCPSRARAIKGSFQSHCRRNVNTKGRPVVVSEEECHLWLPQRLPKVWEPRVSACFYHRQVVPSLAHFLPSLGLVFYHQYKDRVGLKGLEELFCS